MIAYDLRCKNGHEFEGWFKDRKSYEKQMKAKQITCPNCNNTNVEMIITACAIRTKSSKKDEERKNKIADIEKMAGKTARKISNYIRDNFEYVGSEFPQEARKIHYGEAEERNIWGTSTLEEEKELREDGIKFFKIPKPIKYDS